MHHLNEDGDVIFTFLPTHTVKEVINKFRKAIQAQPSMQAAYLELQPELPANYFESKTLWDRMHFVSRLPVFERLYNMIQSGGLSLLWRDDINEDGQCDLFLYTYLRYCIWASPP
jgi:hypothetical protein